MIQREDIRQILNHQIPKGTTMTVQQIKKLVNQNYPLSGDDFKSYVKDRNHPNWEHQVEEVLHDYKKKKIVIHDPSTTSYTF